MLREVLTAKTETIHILKLALRFMQLHTVVQAATILYTTAEVVQALLAKQVVLVEGREDITILQLESMMGKMENMERVEKRNSICRLIVSLSLHITIYNLCGLLQLVAGAHGVMVDI